MNKIAYFIDNFEGEQRKMLEYFHEILISFPTVTCKIRYKIPFYDQNKWFCYLNPIKPDKIALCFLRGNELSNVQGILESKGRKIVSSVEFSSVHEIPKNAIREIINEALILDEISTSHYKKSD